MAIMAGFPEEAKPPASSMLLLSVVVNGNNNNRAAAAHNKFCNGSIVHRTAHQQDHVAYPRRNCRGRRRRVVWAAYHDADRLCLPLCGAPLWPVTCPAQSPFNLPFRCPSANNPDSQVWITGLGLLLLYHLRVKGDPHYQ